MHTNTKSTPKPNKLTAKGVRGGFRVRTRTKAGFVVQISGISVARFKNGSD